MSNMAKLTNRDALINALSANDSAIDMSVVVYLNCPHTTKTNYCATDDCEICKAEWLNKQFQK